MSDMPEVQEMPEGAVLRLVRTGGLRAQTDQLLLFVDGRMRRTRSLRRQTVERRIARDDVREILADLVLAGFFELAPETGEQQPDAYAYEITVRSGAGARTAVMYDGHIPERLAPVLVKLREMLG